MFGLSVDNSFIVWTIFSFFNAELIEDVFDYYKHYKQHKDYEEAKEGMVRSHAAGQKASSDKSKGLSKPHSIPNRARYNESLEKEVKQLREKNEQHRKALNIFKEKLINLYGPMFLVIFSLT